jgi:glutathione S-transferase
VKLDYTPLACGLADHIALQDASVRHERKRVDLRITPTASGGDFPTVNRKGCVPAAAARRRISGRFHLLADRLTHDYLFGDKPSVADYYLFVMLLWAARLVVAAPPALRAVRDRLLLRPAVQPVMREENLAHAAAAQATSTPQEKPRCR